MIPVAGSFPQLPVHWPPLEVEVELLRDVILPETDKALGGMRPRGSRHWVVCQTAYRLKAVSCARVVSVSDEARADPITYTLFPEFFVEEEQAR
jgi:hypothetical protein